VNANLILRITKFMILGLLIFMTACSPWVAIVQPNSAPSPIALPTIAATSTLQPTMLLTFQPTALPKSSPTATSVPVTTECQDAAQYITDDGLDGTTYEPNTAFTKTWRLKNTGSCTWDSRYLVSYIPGETMTQQPGYWIVQQGQTVAPGQTVDISVGMTSPVENGSYESYWGLKKENGPLVPVQGGANGNSFYAKIQVNNGVADRTISAASIDIDLEQGSGTVCTANATYFVHASITADGPTTASYEISSTAGQIAAGNFQPSPTGPVSPIMTGTLIFDQAST
jgi:hypothetical protein